MTLVPPPSVPIGSNAFSVGTFPAILGPFPNVQPFSYQDGLTFQKLFESYRHWLLSELVPHVDKLGDDIYTAYNEASAALAKAMLDYSTEIGADREAFEKEVADRLVEMGDKLGDAEAAKNGAEAARDLAEQWAANTQVLQDTAVKNLANDPNSQTTNALEKQYAPYQTANIARIGGTPDAAMLAAAVQAKNSATTVPINSDPVAHVVIELPPGTMTVSTLNALIGREAMTSKASGLKIRGAGMDVTTVVFSPSTAGALVFNDFWLNISFENVTFIATTADCTFMQSFTTHNAQRFSFDHVTWHGFKYVIELQGNNNNSEIIFNYCHTKRQQNNGAWFYVGSANTSDQFLNYWFIGCTHWTTSAPVLDVARGGHFYFFGLDVSDFGSAMDDTYTRTEIFRLRGSVHSLGVCQLHAVGVRVEAKNSRAALLYSEWPQGNVSIQCDWSSQMNDYTYGDIITLNYVNVPGAILTIHDSNLAGGIKINYAINDWQHRHIVKVKDTTWNQRLTPSEVVSWGVPAGNYIQPGVTFENCRGQFSDAQSANGAAVWDSTMPVINGDLVRPLVKRSVTLRQPGGGLTTNATAKVALPINAVITGLRAISPAGDVSEQATGSWNISTTESTPTVIATVTTPGNRALGYNVVQEITPFQCRTRAQATIVAKGLSAGQAGTYSTLVVEGYW